MRPPTTFYRSSVNVLCFSLDALWDSCAPILTHAPTFFDVWIQISPLLSNGFLSAPTKMNSFLSKEFLLHGLIQESIPQHCPRNNGRGLRQSPFLCIVVNVVLTNRLTLHPSGWSVHRAKEYLDFAITNDKALLCVSLHRIKFQSTDRLADNARHPWHVRVWYPIPRHPMRQFYLKLVLDEQSICPFYLDH